MVGVVGSKPIAPTNFGSTTYGHSTEPPNSRRKCVSSAPWETAAHFPQSAVLHNRASREQDCNEKRGFHNANGNQ